MAPFPVICATFPPGTGAQLASLLGQAPAESLLATSSHTLTVPSLPATSSLALTAVSPIRTSLPSSGHKQGDTTPHLHNCDTGKPLPKKLVEKIQKGEFVELHEFLPKLMLEATKLQDEHPCNCCQNRSQSTHHTHT